MLTYFLINPLVDGVGLVEEFVESEGIEQTFLAQLGELKQFVVATIDSPETAEDLWVLTVLHTQDHQHHCQNTSRRFTSS